MCYRIAFDYFKKIRKKIFLNNICLTFNFAEFVTILSIRRNCNEGWI